MRRLCLVPLLLALALPATADSVFSERQVRILRSLSLDALESPPPSPSNRYADDPAAAALGEAVFFDTDFSRDGSLSCASCHQPERAFTDGRARAEGLARTGRNTPTLIGAAYQDWFYWDGRRDSLWSQALIPFEAASEMGASRLAAVRTLLTDPDYRRQYRAVFGEPPALDWQRLPDQASPIGPAEHQNAWYRLDRNTQATINRTYASLGKAIAAFERTLVPEPTAFDRFVETLDEAGQAAAVERLEPDELAGMKLFIDEERTQCLRCHNGPLLTNGGFHNIGTGVFSGPDMDFGRALGLQAVLMDEFNCRGDYSDAAPEECDALNHLSRDSHQPLEGAFKTPTLRNLDETGPYFHDGRAASVHEVVDHYLSHTQDRPAGGSELEALRLTRQERTSLASFLDYLSRAVD